MEWLVVLSKFQMKMVMVMVTILEETLIGMIVILLFLINHPDNGYSSISTVNPYFNN